MNKTYTIRKHGKNGNTNDVTGTFDELLDYFRCSFAGVFPRGIKSLVKMVNADYSKRYYGFTRPFIELV